jgi:hypothetical protein
VIGFRAVHPDFRSSRGYVWPFPGQTAVAAGPFTDTPDEGCPSHDGDGICLATTAEAMASGGIPAITVLVCSYTKAALLGTEPDGSKVRVKRAKVLRVVDFPAMLRGIVPADPDLPTKANLYGVDLSRANLSGANVSGADLSRANLYGVDLSRANLSGANVSGADLSGADLSGADLYGVDLSRANLSGANVSGAYLPGVNADEWTVLPAGWTVADGRIVGGAS